MRSKHLSPLVSGWIFMATGLALLAASGCCVTRPCGTMASLPCDAAGGCDASCGPTFPASCGSCSQGHGFGGLALPLLSTRLACGSGCGGVYWNEWISDPPDCCDPCNDCGQWVGHGGGNSWNGPTGCGPGHIAHSALRGATHITGSVLRTVIYGYPGACGGCGTCSSCSAHSAGVPMGGPVSGGACTDGCVSSTGTVPSDVQGETTLALQAEPARLPQQAVHAQPVSTRRVAAQRLRR